MLGLAAAASLVVGCAARAGVAPAPAPPSVVPVRVYTRWSGRPDGPLPARGDEGGPLSVHTTGGPQPTISDGALVGNLPAGRQAAAYVLAPVGVKVRRIGAVFGFGQGDGGGSLGLIAWVPSQPPDAHCHVAVTPTRWIASTIEKGALSEFGSGSFETPLVQDGRPYRYEIVFDGATATMMLPDGGTARAGSPAVGRLPGSVACWEFYRDDPTSAPVRLYESWAGG